MFIVNIFRTFVLFLLNHDTASDNSVPLPFSIKHKKVTNFCVGYFLNSILFRNSRSQFFQIHPPVHLFFQQLFGFLFFGCQLIQFYEVCGYGGHFLIELPDLFLQCCYIRLYGFIILLLLISKF